jgi:EpsI family protein
MKGGSNLGRAAAAALVMAGASLLAVTPRTYLADQEQREKLADIVPTKFGDWELDRSVVPVPPSPDVQKTLDETYDEVVAHTFRNRQGQRVMLSLAYGRNQHKGMNIHRPEVCYPAQGFKLTHEPVAGRVKVGPREIAVTRVVAQMGARNEPITYWLMVGEHITHFGHAQRAVSMRYGLRGVIPDGVLVRVSSIDPDNAAAFRLQEGFIVDLLSVIAPARRPRLVGAA